MAGCHDDVADSEAIAEAVSRKESNTTIIYVSRPPPWYDVDVHHSKGIEDASKPTYLYNNSAKKKQFKLSKVAQCEK
jgi:hypothetical protein